MKTEHVFSWFAIKNNGENGRNGSIWQKRCTRNDLEHKETLSVLLFAQHMVDKYRYRMVQEHSSSSVLLYFHIAELKIR